jgi:flagellar biosynthetic protein FliR
MVSLSSAYLQAWIIGLIWPLVRVLGVIATSPIFSHNAIPKRIKLGVGIMLTLIIMPTLPNPTVRDLLITGFTYFNPTTNHWASYWI